MDPNVEWNYDFRLVSAELSPDTMRAMGEELLLQVAVPWAQARDYDIGGSFHPPEYGKRGVWLQSNFGLTATRCGQLIPPEDAEDLMNVIREFANRRGVRTEGGWRAFTAAERAPIPERPE